LQVDANGSKEHTVSIFRAEVPAFSPEDGESMFLQNVGIYLQVHTAPKTRTASVGRQLPGGDGFILQQSHI
jgi:hypothetical protein